MPAELVPWVSFAIAVVVVAVAAVLITILVTIPFRIIARRAHWDPRLVGRLRRPFRLLVLTIGLLIALQFFPDLGWRAILLQVGEILVIASAAWMLAAGIGFLFSRADARYPMDVEDNRVARRVHTQTAILRRVINVAIVVVAIGAILLTFPGVEALGASLLASAGILSVVAAIAAQSTLGNLFAGLQLAFSDAIRVDDVVVVNEEWGRIEEITLTYVVVHIWDDRRLVLPSTNFTTQSFENWTRHSSQLLGSIYFDVDWRVSPARMREHLHLVLETEPLWDGRASVLQVTDAVGGFVNVRILVTAANSGALWDLRCNVREAMVEWLQAEGAAGLPRTRVELVEQQARPPTRPSKPAAREGVFSGSAEAEDRGQAFTQAIPIEEEPQPDA